EADDGEDPDDDQHVQERATAIWSGSHGQKMKPVVEVMFRSVTLSCAVKSRYPGTLSDPVRFSALAITSPGQLAPLEWSGRSERSRRVTRSARTLAELIVAQRAGSLAPVL